MAKMTERPGFASKWMDPKVIQDVKVEYLDVVDRLQDSGLHPSIGVVRKEFSFNVPTETLKYVKGLLVETGEIVESKSERQRKKIDSNYKDYCDEYSFIHNGFMDEGVAPSIAKVRENFSRPLSIETLSEVRRHLISIGELRLGLPGQGAPQVSSEEVDQNSSAIKMENFLASQDKKKRVWAKPTDRYVNQYRQAWRRIRTLGETVECRSYMGVEKRSNTRFTARYTDTKGSRRTAGVYGTAKEAAIARDRKIVSLGLHEVSKTRIRLNFPEIVDAIS